MFRHYVYSVIKQAYSTPSSWARAGQTGPIHSRASKERTARTKSRSMNRQKPEARHIMLQKLLEHEPAQNGYSTVFKTPRCRVLD